MATSSSSKDKLGRRQTEPTPTIHSRAFFRSRSLSRSRALSRLKLSPRCCCCCLKGSLCQLCIPSKEHYKVKSSKFNNHSHQSVHSAVSALTTVKSIRVPRAVKRVRKAACAMANAALALPRGKQNVNNVGRSPD